MLFPFSLTHGSRIVAPDLLGKEKELESKLHDHTYGITSDPLTQFAVVFSAMIHDVDHSGLPNATLVRDKTDLAEYYKVSLFSFGSGLGR